MKQDVVAVKSVVGIILRTFDSLVIVLLEDDFEGVVVAVIVVAGTDSIC
jgi:hypothetical protein